VVGDILFTITSYSEAMNGVANTVPAANVKVNIYGTGLPNIATGFTFSPNAGYTWGLNYPGGSDTYYGDFNIGFNAAFSSSFVSTGYNFNSAGLVLNETINNPNAVPADDLTSVSVGESIQDKNHNPLGPGGQFGTTQSASNSNAVAGSTGWSASSVFINKDTSLIDGTDNGSSVFVSSITETVTFNGGTIPEPRTFVLAGAGVGLVFLLRRRKKAAGLLVILGLLVIASAGSASASPLCLSTTLDVYTASGFQCSNGDFNFSNFTYSGSGSAKIDRSNQSSFAPASGISMSPLSDGFQLAITNPQDTTTGNAEVTFTLGFEVQSHDPITALYTGSSVTIAPSLGGCGPLVACIDYSITLEPVGGGAPYSSQSYHDPTTASQNDASFVIPAGTWVAFSETVDMRSSGSGASTHLSGLAIELTADAGPVPEPVTMVLTGSALIGLAAYLRRRRGSGI